VAKTSTQPSALHQFFLISNSELSTDIDNPNCKVPKASPATVQRWNWFPIKLSLNVTQQTSHPRCVKQPTSESSITLESNLTIERRGKKAFENLFAFSLSSKQPQKITKKKRRKFYRFLFTSSVFSFGLILYFWKVPPNGKVRKARQASGCSRRRRVCLSLGDLFAARGLFLRVLCLSNVQQNLCMFTQKEISRSLSLSQAPFKNILSI
jgi:hypothetical protein